MSLSFLIAFITSFILFWAVDLVLLRANFNKKLELDYKFSRYFSFESHNFNSPANVFLRILYIALSILSITPFVYFLAISKVSHTLDVYVIISGTFLLISVIFKIILYFTKLINLKMFLITYVVRFLTLASSILAMSVGIIISFSTQLGSFHDRTWLLVLFLVLFNILFFISISCLFNKRFYEWYILEKDEEGNMIRPKIVYLALYEWIYNFVEIAFVVIACIFIYFI